MGNTTRWNVQKENIENGTNNFDYLVNILKKIDGRHFKNQTNSVEYSSFSILEQGEEYITINNQNVHYYFSEFKYQKINLGETSEFKNHVIIYEMNEQTNIILDKNTGALSFLRLFFEVKPNKVISQTNTFVDSDFIIWCIYKVYNKDVIYEVNNNKLELNLVLGFQGNTEDERNKITAKGDSLLNILSALSFLLETTKLNRIGLRMEYSEHANLEMNLTNSNIVTVDFEKYKGAYKKSPYNELSDIHKITLVNLLVYNEILPILNDWYTESKEEQSDLDESNKGIVVWNNEEHKKFLEKVARDLTNKINAKISEDLSH